MGGGGGRGHGKGQTQGGDYVADTTCPSFKANSLACLSQMYDIKSRAIHTATNKMPYVFVQMQQRFWPTVSSAQLPSSCLKNCDTAQPTCHTHKAIY